MGVNLSDLTEPRYIELSELNGKHIAIDAYNTIYQFLSALDISREQLVDVCILMGTDFNNGISGIGPKKGLKLIKDYGDIEGALEHLGKEIPEYQEIRDIFLRGTYSNDYDLSPKEIDKDATIEFLVDHDFSKERVTSAITKIETARKNNKAKRQQRSLDAWF